MWRIVTFSFTGKSTYEGTFAIEVDNSGVPIQTGGNLNFTSISGDAVETCTYVGSDVYIKNLKVPGAGQFSNFALAIEGQTYTESGDFLGSWSYIKASSSTEWRQITYSFSGKEGTTSGTFVIEVSAFTGVPITTGLYYNFASVSGDKVNEVVYTDSKDLLQFNTDNGYGACSSFRTAVASQTYIEVAGTWSYVITTPTLYSITATAVVGGTISPSGNVSVVAGGSKTFEMTPAQGYQISSVLVDGTDVGAVDTYIFSNVQANHTISASFEEIPTYDIIIQTNCGTGYVGEVNWKNFVDSLNHTLFGGTSYDGTTQIGTFAIYSTSILPSPFAGQSSYIVSIILPDCFTEIEDAAFAGCSNMVSITLPDTIEVIGADVFSECTSLTSLELPASVTKVGEGFLDACDALETLTCNSPVPPTTGSTISTLTLPELRVPNNSLNLYLGSPVWSAAFNVISPIKPSPVRGYGFNTSAMIDTDFLNEVFIRRN